MRTASGLFLGLGGCLASLALGEKQDSVGREGGREGREGRAGREGGREGGKHLSPSFLSLVAPCDGLPEDGGGPSYGMGGPQAPADQPERRRDD